MDPDMHAPRRFPHQLKPRTYEDDKNNQSFVCFAYIIVFKITLNMYIFYETFIDNNGYYVLTLISKNAKNVYSNPVKICFFMRYSIVECI